MIDEASPSHPLPPTQHPLPGHHPPSTQHHILSEMSSTVSQLCIPMSQHILQLQFDDDGDLYDDTGDDDVNDVSDLDDDDIGDDGDDGDDVGDDDGKEAKTTPGSDLYWPALPGASGGIKPSELYCSNIRNVVSIYLNGSTIYCVQIYPTS